MDMQIQQFISHLSSFLIKQFMFVSMFHNCIPFLSTNHSIMRMTDRICLYLYCFVYMYKLLIQFGIYHYFIDLQLAQIVRYILYLISYFTRFNGFVSSHQFLICYSIPCFFLSLFSETSKCIIPQLYLSKLSRYNLQP